MEIKTRVIKGQYHDSVSLMLVAKEIKNVEGVLDAAVMMGTDANKNLLKQAGLLTMEANEAAPDDLMIVIKKDQDVDEVLMQTDAFLNKSAAHESGSGLGTPKSLRSAVVRNQKINFVEISVAGAYAAREAREALASGLHVLLFSDNVSLDDEVSLKKFAVSQGLLLMGPGAGTAIINNIGLGFSNALSVGSIGIVSAAGTGLQEVSTILARHGVGISQAIGTGGRDLSKKVGGLMAIASIQALNEDENTKVIILISKPADDNVVQEVIRTMIAGGKECVICILGANIGKLKEGNIHFTRTLEECAHTAAMIAGVELPDYQIFIKSEIEKQQLQAVTLRKELNTEQKFIRGLYSGGTLCYESQVIWNELLKNPVYSNAPLEKNHYLEDNNTPQCHTAIDLGEEEFTVGRPHPMIDNDLRLRYISMVGDDPRTAVIVMDVLIGYGAHGNPGFELGEGIRMAIQKAKDQGRHLPVITCVTGTEKDPQSLNRTRAQLKEAGAIVCETNAHAARLAAMLVVSQ